VNNAEIVNKTEEVAQVVTCLQEFLSRVPFLKVLDVKRDVRLTNGGSRELDGLIRVAAGEEEWSLILEIKHPGHPQQVRTAVLQLKDALTRLPNARHYGILGARFLSEQSRAICKGAEIGYADLAGNVRISFDRIFIETSSPQNPFRLRKAVGSIFSPRGTRVLRVLLQGPFRSWKVRDLARSAQVSVGWVSSVRKHLLEQEWAAEDPTGFKVTRPHAILDSWVKQPHTWPKNAEIRDYSVLLNDPEELAAKLKEAFARTGGRIYTVVCCLAAPSVHGNPDRDGLCEILSRRRPHQGKIAGPTRFRREGTTAIVLPKDQGALNRPKQSWLPIGFGRSDLLDLLGAGLRGDEQAAELRKWSDFAGGGCHEQIRNVWRVPSGQSGLG